MSDGELLIVALIWLVVLNVATSKRVANVALIGGITALIVLGWRLLT